MTAARNLKQDWKNLLADEISEGLSVVSAAELGKSKCDPVGKVLVVENLNPVDLLNLALEKGSHHTVQSNSVTFDRELLAAAKLVVQPKRLEEFPISAILNPAECGSEKEIELTLLNERFSLASEKSHILRLVETILDGKIKSTGLRADIITVADELLTNAIFNAPFVDLGNTTPGESRENPGVKMTEGKSGRFFLGATSDQIVIGCRDPYGSLNPQRLLERVRNCYQKSVAATMNMEGAGGAGIGSFMIYNSSSSYYVAVDQLKTTIVCAVLPLKGSGRQRQEAPKSLHIINLEEK